MPTLKMTGSRGKDLTGRILTVGTLATALVLSVVIMSGCANLDDPDPILTLQTQEIVGGQREHGYEAVGALIRDGETLCTGTLISSDAVLTAAHCFLGNTSPSGLTFFIGSSANGTSGSETQVASITVHPSFDIYYLTNDIAIMRLSNTVSTTPIPMSSTPMDSSFVGQNAVFVGYGITSGQSQWAGEKYSTIIPISEIYEGSFRYDHPTRNTCRGDSGGPALLTINGSEQLIGVTSWGDEDCLEFGVDTRVDVYFNWVQDALAGAGASDPGVSGSGSGPAGDDICEDNGWYGDGYCDEDCARPDPDCSETGGDSGGFDYCAFFDWYNDGFCDVDCPQPDPDCDGGGDGDGDGRPGENEGSGSGAPVMLCSQSAGGANWLVILLPLLWLGIRISKTRRD